MGIWRRRVVVGRKCGRKRVKMQATTLLNKTHHGGSMERKLQQLQRLIPGGGAAREQVVDMEALFQKIAVYIILLESRVKLLKNVYTLFGPDD